MEIVGYGGSRDMYKHDIQSVMLTLIQVTYRLLDLFLRNFCNTIFEM